MAWEPPTGIGQPSVCANVPSIRATPAGASAGRAAMACPATPVSMAGATSPRKGKFHSGVPWSATRAPKASAPRSPFGERSGCGRLRMSANEIPTVASTSRTSGANVRIQAGPSPSRAVAVRSRSRQDAAQNLVASVVADDDDAHALVLDLPARAARVRQLVSSRRPQDGGGRESAHSESRFRPAAQAPCATRRRSASGRVRRENAPPTSRAVLKEKPAAIAPMSTEPRPVPVSKPMFHTALAEP